MSKCTNCGFKLTLSYKSTMSFDDIITILQDIIEHEKENIMHKRFENDNLDVCNQGVIYGLKIAKSEIYKNHNKKITVTSK